MELWLRLLMALLCMVSWCGVGIMIAFDLKNDVWDRSDRITFGFLSVLLFVWGILIAYGMIFCVE